MKVVAFDIDGTLEQDNVMNIYKQIQDRRDIIIGVITARNPSSMRRFIRNNNIETDFQKSALVKTRPFINVRLAFDGDKFIYIGNTTRDRVGSFMTGWKFIHADEVTKRRILE